MIDANVLLRRWIMEGLSTERVSACILPAYDVANTYGFRPYEDDGETPTEPWTVVSVRGGSAHPEAPLLYCSMQVRVWAAREEFLAARARYLEIFYLIHGQTAVDFDTDGHVISCIEEEQGQDVTDNETGWATVISFFELKARSN